MTIKNYIPLVSIIIPTYNQEKVIIEAVNSAIMQNYNNIEIIISDDASNDRTNEILTSLKHPRVKCYRNHKNIGRIANYRKCLNEYANGDWVVNLDGDDKFTDDNFIKDAISISEIDKDILIISAWIKTNGGFVKNYIKNSKDSFCILKGHEALVKFSNGKYPMFHLSSLYKKKEAIECNFYSENIMSTDTDSLWRLAMKGKVAKLDKIVGIWNVTRTSITKKSAINDRIKDLSFWTKIIQTGIEYGMPLKIARNTHTKLTSIWLYNHLSIVALNKQYKDLFFLIKYSLKNYNIKVTILSMLKWRLYARIIIGIIKNY